MDRLLRRFDLDPLVTVKVRDSTAQLTRQGRGFKGNRTSPAFDQGYVWAWTATFQPMILKRGLKDTCNQVCHEVLLLLTSLVLY